MKGAMSKSKAALFPILVRETRRFIANAILFNQRLAEGLGVNATDYQVLNLLDLRGSAKPGELARLTGLTTGGVTVALDRLEKAGFVRRVKNPGDRRSLIVYPVPNKMRKTLEMYKPVIAAMQHLVASYDERELKLIVDFFTRANATREA
jgi:DNA-binding MarR family transcriptional regulator